ncbi:MAG: aminotransferase class I/II-fold pyridoxal phosphate-dependent enzyme [Verrucomicrobiales bacterium]
MEPCSWSTKPTLLASSAQGVGLAAELGLSDHVNLQLGTLSKAAGLSGGFVAASGELCDLLVNRSRAFIWLYSTGPGPGPRGNGPHFIVAIGWSGGGSAPEGRLRQHLDSLSAAPGGILESAIFPVILGSNERALAAAAELLEEGFLVPAIRYPTVPRGSARLRRTLSAAHEAFDVTALCGDFGPQGRTDCNCWSNPRYSRFSGSAPPGPAPLAPLRRSARRHDARWRGR